MSTSKGAAKLIRGSFLLMISNLLFRVGGYVYRFLMARMLGPEGYGILGYTLFFQGVFQVLSAGGLPPAIAKYVSQHKALEEDQMASQVVFTSLKFMMFLGIFFSLVMFFIGPIIANNIWHKPEVALPLQAVALITPFSVIVGAFRGAFQGIYKMEYVVITRAVEQVFMIVFAVVLVMLGFYAAGAVIGTGIGFMASAVSAIIIFKKYMWKYLPSLDPEHKFNFRQELGLIKTLLIFSIPVIITALSEMTIYGASIFILGIFMATKFSGYYNAVDPVARLPLVISLSVATAVLPAASEAFALKDQKLLTTYVVQSYRLVVLTVLPLCIGIAIFAKPLLELLFGSNFVFGSGALSILVIGMAFYTMFMVSSSIAQGLGYPRLPMYILVVGSIINVALNWFLIQSYGIIGAALATTITAFIIMIPILWKTYKITKVSLPFGSFAKITLASTIMGLGIFLLPQTIPGLILAIIIAPVIYTIALVFLKGFEKRDVRIMRRMGSKLGPLSSINEKLVKFIEKYSL
jgi:stage V sporulation protein B